MPSVISRAILFLSGYLPLFLIFTVQYYQHYKWWALIPLSLAAVAAVGLFMFLKWVQAGEPRPLKIENVQRKDAEVIAYIFAYVFPFLGLKIDDPANVIGLAIFFLVLMILNVSSNMVHINPALNLLGYHVYDITTVDEDSHTVITRRNRLVRGTELRVVLVSDGVSMER